MNMCLREKTITMWGCQSFRRRTFKSQSFSIGDYSSVSSSIDVGGMCWKNFTVMADSWSASLAHSRRRGCYEYGIPEDAEPSFWDRIKNLFMGIKFRKIGAA